MIGALGLVLFVAWVVACERLIMRHIDNSLMSPFEADLRAERAKREKLEAGLRAERAKREKVVANLRAKRLKREKCHD